MKCLHKEEEKAATSWNKKIGLLDNLRNRKTGSIKNMFIALGYLLRTPNLSFYGYYEASVLHLTKTLNILES